MVSKDSKNLQSRGMYWPVQMCKVVTFFFTPICCVDTLMLSCLLCTYNVNDAHYGKPFVSGLLFTCGTSYMMTSSNGNIFVLRVLCEGNLLVTGGFPSQRPVTLSFMFSLICAWTSCLANKRGVGDVRRHRAHYDVTVMINYNKLSVHNITVPDLWNSIRTLNVCYDLFI